MPKELRTRATQFYHPEQKPSTYRNHFNRKKQKSVEYRVSTETRALSLIGVPFYPGMCPISPCDLTSRVTALRPLFIFAGRARFYGISALWRIPRAF